MRATILAVCFACLAVPLNRAGAAEELTWTYNQPTADQAAVALPIQLGVQQAGFAAIQQPGVQIAAVPTVPSVPAGSNGACCNTVENNVGKCCDAECTHWFADAEAIVLWRDNQSRNPQISQFGFSAGAGPRILIGYRSDENHSMEAEYFSAIGMDWRIKPTNEIVDYDSDINNLEFNFVRSSYELSLLAGFRFVNLGETFEEQYRRENITLVRRLRNTDNNLFGGQLGIRWRVDEKRVFWEATGKAGIYENDAGDSYKFDFWMYNAHRSHSYDKSVAAFVGELNFAAGVRLTPVWMLRTGLDAIWIDRVILAPDVWPSVPSPTDGSAFLHGFDIGFSGRW
jgi:hypothetical protein